MKCLLIFILSTVLASCGDNSSGGKADPNVGPADFKGLVTTGTSYDQGTIDTFSLRYAIAKYYRNEKGEKVLGVMLWENQVTSDVCVDDQNVNNSVIQRKFDLFNLKPVIGLKQRTVEYTDSSHQKNPDDVEVYYMFYDVTKTSPASPNGVRASNISFAGEITIEDLNQESVLLNFDLIKSSISFRPDHIANASINGRIRVKLCK